MDVIIVGAGRAGGSLAIALEPTDHTVIGVLSRSASPYGPSLEWDDPLPVADLLVLAVPDGAISPIAERIAPHSERVGAAVHLSGFTSVRALDPLAELGIPVGSLHPLQTLPDPIRGAAALAGSFAGITAEGDLRHRLHRLASAVGMHPFDLDDGDKEAYHAAASSAASYVVTALGLAADLLANTSVPDGVLRPLVDRVVANTFETGASAAMTGPIVRGDEATVTGQQLVADAVSASVGAQFELLARATRARLSRRS